MKKNFFILAVILLLTMTNFTIKNDAFYTAEKNKNVSRQFYQLKTYLLTTEEQVQQTDAFLKNAFLPALKKFKIGPVGVFKPIATADSIQKILVLIPFTTLSQFHSLEEALQQDKAYVQASNNYNNAKQDKPSYQRIESVILQAFKDMPILKTPSLAGQRTKRVYELRSYESSSENYFKNKVDMFNEGGEIKLFERLDFNAVFYGEVLVGSHMPNLMYLTAFSDQESRDAHWKAFGEAPEWKALIELPKYKNNVSHIDILFLYPTEYSDY